MDQKQYERDLAKSEAALKIIAKIEKLAPEIKQEMDEMNDVDLKRRVLDAEHNLFVSERNKKSDERLKEAKAEYDMLKEPYAETKKLQTAIIAYGMIALESRGADVGNGDVEDESPAAAIERIARISNAEEADAAIDEFIESRDRIDAVEMRGLERKVAEIVQSDSARVEEARSANDEGPDVFGEETAR